MKTIAKLPEGGKVHRFLLKFCGFPESPFHRAGRWMYLPDWWYIANNKPWPLSTRDKLFLTFFWTSMNTLLLGVVYADMWFSFGFALLFGVWLTISILIDKRSNGFDDLGDMIWHRLTLGSNTTRLWLFNQSKSSAEFDEAQFRICFKHAINRVLTDGMPPHLEIPQHTILHRMEQGSFIELADMFVSHVDDEKKVEKEDK